MKCQFLGSQWPIVNRWHRLHCDDCRAARAADFTLARGIQRLRAEAPPAGGLERAIGAFGGAAVRRRSRSRHAIVCRRFVSAGSLTALTGICAAGWLAYIDIDPKVSLPVPAVPSPNALDVLASAASAIPASERTARVSALVYDDYSRSKVNAALESAIAGGTGPSTNLQRHVPANAPRILPRLAVPGSGAPKIMLTSQTQATEPHFYSMKERAELVQQYGPALSLVRKSFSYEYQAPPIRSLLAHLPYLADDRQLARALELEAEVKLERGDLAGALSSCLDNIELGMKISHGAQLSGALTGIALDAMGRKAVWPLTRRISAGTARAAARRMERIIGLQVPYSETLQEEKWSTLAGIEELFQKPNWRQLLYANGSNNDLPQVSATMSFLRLLPYSKGRILDDYSKLAEADICDAQQPYGFSAQTMHGSELRPENYSFNKGANWDPIVQLIYPSFGQARFREVASSETQHALLAAAFAIRAYELERHRLPHRLDDLVPEYLSAVPIDPFGGCQPLRYHDVMRTIELSPGRRVRVVDLYSIGPDGIDDGGTPVRNPEPGQQVLVGQAEAARERVMFQVKPDSKGDIVAGVNTF